LSTLHLFDRPKVDSHCHVLDPARFPYGDAIPYHPAGQELGTADYFQHVMAAYGVRHALLVGPNSGYGTDNRCLLDAIARGEGRFKGIAVVPSDTGRAALAALQAQGIVGIAFNPALHGSAYYQDIGPLLAHMESLGLFAQLQVSNDQLLDFLPLIQATGIRILIDHCGRPDLSAGTQAAGLQALLALADTGRATIKLSGFAKYSGQVFPFEDARAHTRLLMDRFGPAHCLWASDWPYLRAPYRMDYGTLLRLAESWFSPEELQAILWDTPTQLFGWKS
jgi:predicted TIM-barrel fold metal-dependent hydrolase